MTEKSERIKTYKEFYHFYLTEHENKTCRWLHFTGTAILFTDVIYLSIAGLWAEFWWTLPVIGYGFAWVGHFFFEKNKPATFKYPLWSLFSDFRMFFEMLTRKIK
ncbi:MAG: DUF962 domain-containing protein [Bacteroidales bacterium]|nr:DUF962 domain-containing protein [Bacteroidales bacterium]